MVARDETLIEQNIEASALRRGVKFNELPSSDSRSSALNWLLHEDQMQLHQLDSNLIQRYTLALLAFEFGSDFISSVDWLSDEDECTWGGVSCTVDGKVSKLELGTFLSLMQRLK
jgi:hypothetical protein